MDYEERRRRAEDRASGFYWVFLRNQPVTIARWVNLGDGDGSWYLSGSDWDIGDDEVTVLSDRLTIEPNEGWPPEALRVRHQ